VSDYRNLEVWQKAHALALRIYQTTISFPKDELYGMTSQIRRAAVSIPANLAEGSGRSSKPEFARFSRISLGSANEVEYFLLLARDLGYLPEALHQELSAEVSRIRRTLSGLIHSMDS
jgi:four helix bundle protein